MHFFLNTSRCSATLINTGSMSLTTTGCTLPIDLAVGGYCVVGSFGGSLVISIIATIAIGLVVATAKAAFSLVPDAQSILEDSEREHARQIIKCLYAHLEPAEMIVAVRLGVFRLIGVRYFNRLFVTADVLQGLEGISAGNLDRTPLREDQGIDVVLQDLDDVTSEDLTGLEQSFADDIASALNFSISEFSQALDFAFEDSIQLRLNGR